MVSCSGINISTYIHIYAVGHISRHLMMVGHISRHSVMVGHIHVSRDSIHHYICLVFRNANMHTNMSTLKLIINYP